MNQRNNRPQQRTQALQKADLQKFSDDVEAAIETCSVEHITTTMKGMGQAIAMASGIQTLKELLTDAIIAEVFMPLRGSPLGFRTDRDDQSRDGTPPPYDIPVMREALVETMMRGFRPIGNEMNIIAGRAYFTKEGFERKVREFEGLTDLDWQPGVPSMKDGGALVPYRATYKLKGKPGEFVADVVKMKDETTGDEHVVDLRIPIRVNKMMGADAILGKARRKFAARLYEKLSGISTPEGDLDGDDVIDTTGVPAPAPQRGGGTAAQAERLAQKHKGERMREPGEEG